MEILKIKDRYVTDIDFSIERNLIKEPIVNIKMILIGEKDYAYVFVENEEAELVRKQLINDMTYLEKDIVVEFIDQEMSNKLENLSLEDKMVKKILNQLKKEKLLNIKNNSYKNTEKLLYSLNVLPQAIKLLEEEIELLEIDNKEIEKIPGNSKRLIIDGNENTYIYGSDVLSNRISELKQTVAKTKSQIRIVKNTLKKFEKDEYYPIIEEYYLNKKTIAEIEEVYGWSYGTISKHKKRLINEIKVLLFPNIFIKELQN